MEGNLVAPPVLSTPDAHLFVDPTPVSKSSFGERLSDDGVRHVYEIERTAREIRAGRWRRVALQFPDSMLNDAPRVFQFLQQALKDLPPKIAETDSDVEDVAKAVQELDIAKQNIPKQPSEDRLFILADTSYGACCVDEIAAEHVDADVVVHYGRSCLSPTARLPVVYVFTTHKLPIDPVTEAFQQTYTEKDNKVILMADITYSDLIPTILEQVTALGYTNVFAPSIIHDPASPLPNRTVPPTVGSGENKLQDYSLFHISEPPPSLLLTLSSRLKSMYIYPTNTANPQALEAQTSRLLMRRYATLTSLNTCSIFGILINTLSVKNYMPTVDAIKAQIAAAGKKSYTFVVGKVNAAKVANFSEIGGWVVIGCWESSLLDSTEFFRPIITPFELGLALMSDEERVWTGEWNGDFSDIINKPLVPRTVKRDAEEPIDGDNEGSDEEEDSAPPEFDLRTGRYISHSRPMHPPKTTQSASNDMTGETVARTSSALMKRANEDLAMINGTASPGAEYLRSQRTWKGLGSDFEVAYDNDDGQLGAQVEQGRGGVARGYTLGGEGDRH
ncbi:Diphthamide biosynthesis protein 2 [Pseudogymnoascus destructans]|uniref:2-(3-amino-3-carboxypropyl)histidine synthase subunit 2 n=2 Tax=Pseudogymnoascus destructans TaxID=655981 RepID=L8FZV6_PSED2|nr:Diphthamide biosynthesis protein 2 [Pseudogymnoascus destructans]ELR06008.1 diphthamide biosynthesis protein 2 [Pseudogymnoascus destructans 20631-21]OAF60592.1 Diphthamide biosynthesis protein 2 [Pseudogymnoascus destructans]